MQSATSELSDEQWRDLLREALDVGVRERPDLPVPGARLAQIITRAARDRRLSLPQWSSVPGRRFVDVLARFPDVVAVGRRPGTDVLAAPAGRPELLNEERPSARLRHDLLRALTEIAADGTAPWYDAMRDVVTWRREGSAPAPGLVRMPDPLATGTALRRRFAGGQPAPAREALLVALDAAHPLSVFADALRRARLQGAWREYRMPALIATLQRWAAEVGVPWRGTWITEGRPVPAASATLGRVPSHLPSSTNASGGASAYPEGEASREGRPPEGACAADPDAEGGPAEPSPLEPDTPDSLALAFARLEDADLARIMVPADLLRKMLRRRG